MLAPEQIYEISQEISRKYSPMVSAKSFGLAKRIALTSKELFEISEEITRKYAPKLNSDTPKLLLLPIDPQHLYASWNLGDSKVTSVAMDDTHKQDIVLRIYPKRDETITVNAVNDWFDVAIKPEQTRQKVLIPKEYKASKYTAAIGKLDLEDHLTVLATSKAAYPLRAIEAGHPTGYSGMPANNLFQAFSTNQEKLPDSRYNVSSRGIN